MKGYPKYFNSKQDFINIIRDDLDRKKTRDHLQALLNTAKRKEPVWPVGYDPDKPPEPPAEPVQPVDWKEVDNPGGSIFLKGFTVDEVNGLVEVVDEILPFRDEIQDLEYSINRELYVDAKAHRASLDLKKPWLPAQAKTALSADEPLAAALDAEDKETALSEIYAVISQVQTVLEERLNIV